MHSPHDNKNKVAQLLAEIDGGNEEALRELVALLYPELKKIAHFQLAGERPGHTLNTTAIVHEAFARLASSKSGWADRGHFLRAAARVMRHLLVDHARRRNAEKRGGSSEPMTLEEQRIETSDGSMAILALDAAIKDMVSFDPRLEQVVECRYFAGLSVADTAQALDVSVRTIERDSRRAKGYVLKAMEAHGLE